MKTSVKRDGDKVWIEGVSGWFVGDKDWAKATSWNSALVLPSNQNRGTWHRVQPYLNTDVISVKDVGVEDFGDEWLVNPTDRWRNGLSGAINVT